MIDFSLQIPTKIYFGRDSLSHLDEEVRHYGDRVLLVYGGGSIKRIGLYDKVMEVLNEQSCRVWEISGVKPNPRLGLVQEGAALCKEQQIQLVLAVGRRQRHRHGQGHCQRRLLRWRPMGSVRRHVQKRPRPAAGRYRHNPRCGQ